MNKKTGIGTRRTFGIVFETSQTSLANLTKYNNLLTFINYLIFI